MDLSMKPRIRDFVLVCIQPNQNAQKIKTIKKEAKAIYKKFSNSKNKLSFQTGVWGGMRLIDFAVVGGHELLLKVIIDHLHVDPKIPDPEYNKSPLHHAAEGGRNAMIEALITEYGCPIDAIDKCCSSPLNFALFTGRDTTLDLLLRCGACAELRNFFGLPIHYAAYSGNTYAVKRLHEVNAASASSVEFGFCTPMQAALTTGSFECIKFLAEVI